MHKWQKTMKKIISVLILWVVVLQLKSQEVKKCFVYKTFPYKGSSKDSATEPISIDYYDGKARLVRSVTPENDGDSGVTIYRYNKQGDLISRISVGKTSIPEVVGFTNKLFSEKNKYQYDKKGKILKQITTRYQFGKFYEIFDHTYTKYSLILLHYTKINNFKHGVFDSKGVDVYDKKGRTVASYSIGAKGDTLGVLRYAYFPIQDTTKTRADTAMLRNIYSVSYQNQFGKEELLEYYYEGKPRGTERKVYDANRNIINDSKYIETKRKTDETTYAYDKKGELIEKKEDNIDEGPLTVYHYRSGKISREDHFYNYILTHSIVYKYEPELK